MRKVIDDPRLMVRVCDLYYNQGISRAADCQRLEFVQTYGVEGTGTFPPENKAL